MDPDGDERTVEQLDSRRLTDARVTTLANGLAGDLWMGSRNGLNRLVSPRARSIAFHRVRAIPMRLQTVSLRRCYSIVSAGSGSEQKAGASRFSFAAKQGGPYSEGSASSKGCPTTTSTR